MQSGSRGGGKENRFSVSKPHLARGERKRRRPDRWEGHVAAWRLPRGSPSWGPAHRHPALWGPDGLLPANSSSPRRTRGCAEGPWGPAPQAPAPQDVHSLGFARSTQGGPGRAAPLSGSPRAACLPGASTPRGRSRSRRNRRPGGGARPRAPARRAAPLRGPAAPGGPGSGPRKPRAASPLPARRPGRRAANSGPSWAPPALQRHAL